MPGNGNGSSSAHSEADGSEKNIEFSDTRLLDEEFGTIGNADSSDDVAEGGPDSRQNNLSEAEIKAIFQDDLDYEFQNWPDEDEFKDESKQDSRPDVSDPIQVDKIAAGQSDAARLHGGRERDSGISENSAPAANAETGESSRGKDAEIEPGAGDESSAFGESGERIPSKSRIREIFGSRSALIYAAIAFVLVVGAFQAVKFSGIGLGLSELGSQASNLGAAIRIFSDGAENQAAPLDTASRIQDGGSFQKPNQTRTDQTSSLAGQLPGNRDENSGGGRGRSNILFYAENGTYRSDPIDAGDMAAWNAMQSGESRLAHSFGRLWGEQGRQSLAETIIRDGPSGHRDVKARVQDQPGGSEPAARDPESFASQDIGGSGKQRLASNTAGASRIYSRDAHGNRLVGVESDIGATSEFDEYATIAYPQLRELEGRLLLVEEILAKRSREGDGNSDIRSAPVTAGDAVEANRAEIELAMQSLQLLSGKDGTVAQLENSIARLEERSDNLAIDMVALAEIAATGRASEKFSLGAGNEPPAEQLGFQSGAGGLVYDHSPVRFLSDDFAADNETAVRSNRRDGSGYAYSVSSETQEFGIGAEMLSPGDRLASVGTILETIKDKDGGLLIVASYGAFYVEPE
ncbi:MAG: hypothetical protein OXC26_10935 [Albidovulum sp.]|nr:hypothetical protein [Albidovulum sp.]